MFIANLQNIGSLTGPEEYHIGRSVPSVSILYFFTEKTTTFDFHPGKIY